MLAVTHREKADRVMGNPVSLFWLCYRDGAPLIGAVISESSTFIFARMLAFKASADAGWKLEGFALDEQGRAKIPAEMLNRLLSARELARLERAIVRKKPAAGSIRKQAGARR